MFKHYRNLRISRRADIVALLVIAGFFVIFFWPMLFGDEYFVTSDAFFYSYPLRTVAWNSLKQGLAPVWTPLLMSGYPLLSMGQIALGYPLTWGYLFLPGYKAEVIYVLAPFLLAPVFTYLYARQLGRSLLASLLAGLAFGYGGMMAGMLSNSGYTSNSVMWMPLMLVGIERCRRGPFTVSLLLTTCAYSLSVLNGHTQTFLFIGLLTIAYAIFVGFALTAPTPGEKGWSKWTNWRRLKPLAVIGLAICGAAGIAAFQIFETVRATQLSIRHELPYEVFIEGSVTLPDTIKSALMPLHYDLEVTTYVTAPALALAVFAVVITLRRRKRDLRVFFWLTVAVVALILMLGGNSPLYKLIYQVPFLNRFRVPARHSFEWTFAASILAAYGWDAITAVIRIKVPAAKLKLRPRRLPWLSLASLVAAIILASLWWISVYHATGEMYYSRTPYPPERYLLYKVTFLIVIFVALWSAWLLDARWFRTVLLMSAVVIACFPEPYMLLSRWWFTAAKPARRFELITGSTQFLQAHDPAENRVYSRVNLFVEENAEHPLLDPPNLTAIFGLHNVGGYEPLILERYSRALDNVGYDSVTTRPGWKSESTIFDDRSHVLDILNTRFILTYKNTLYAEGCLAISAGCPTINKDGVKVSTAGEAVEITPGASASLDIDEVEADSLALVTSLSNGAGEPQDSTVAALRVVDSDGRVYEHSLRAGIETAEWAHERPDVRANVRHSLATVFDGRPGDLSNTFTAYKYWARVNFPERLRIKRLEIGNTSQSSTVVVWQGSFHDSERNLSTPLTNPLVTFESRWWNVSAGGPSVLLDRIKFQDNDQPAELRPGESVVLSLQASSGDTLALVTSLAHAAAVEQKSSVAKVSIVLSDGSEVEHQLRAGVDTAEWAHERDDVRAIARHQLAEVFDSKRVEGPDNFTAYRYLTRIPVTKPVNKVQARIVNTGDVATITVWKAALYAAVPSTAKTTSPEAWVRWRPVYDRDNVVIYQNDRTLPRAWLVSEIAATDSERALKIIRGEAEPAFDPKQTALVETNGQPLPSVPGGKLPADAWARIVNSEPHSLTIQTNADQPTFLVVSEVAYPGWAAIIDGVETPIYVTNYLLRGVALPAGSHRVEMRYTAPWAKAGALVSILSLVFVLGLALFSIKTTRSRRHRAE